jgi:hypothetical protein
MVPLGPIADVLCEFDDSVRLLRRYTNLVFAATCNPGAANSSGDFTAF